MMNMGILNNLNKSIQKGQRPATRDELIMGVLVLFCFFLFLFMGIKYMDAQKDFERATTLLETRSKVNYERFEMCGRRILESEFGINGIYFDSKGYYCVWTKDRVEEFINNTDYHEACHSMIISHKINKEHFCG